MQRNKEYTHFLSAFHVFANSCWCAMYINMNESSVHQSSYIVHPNNQKLSNNWNEFTTFENNHINENANKKKARQIVNKAAYIKC